MKGLVKNSTVVILFTLVGALLVGFLASIGNIKFIFFGMATIAFLFLVLINERLALALYIPLNLSGDLGLLALEDVAISGLNLQTLTTAILLLGLLLRIIVNRTPLKKSELNMPVFISLFVIYTLWSFWNFGKFTIPDSYHLAILKRFLTMAMIFFIAVNSKPNRFWLKVYLWTALVSGLIFSLRDIVIYIQAGGGQFILDWHELRMAETTGLDLIGGNVTLQGLFFALSFNQLIAPKASNRLIAGIIAFFSITVVFLSFYRAAMVMIAVIIIISALFHKGWQRWAVLGAVFLILLFVFPSAFIERFSSTFTGNESIIGMNLDLTRRASFYWPLALEQSIQYMPFGIGLGNANPPTFNIFLRWWLEFGVIGLVCGLWFVIATSVFLLRRFLKENELFLRGIGISLLAAWTGIMIRGLTGDIIQQIWFSIFLLLLGSYVGIYEGDAHTQRLIRIRAVNGK